MFRFFYFTTHHFILPLVTKVNFTPYSWLIFVETKRLDMRNKPIKIVIAAGLTPMEESSEIAIKLRQKFLSGKGDQIDKKRIGDNIEISHLTTNIIIERKIDNLIEYVKCNVCGCEYQNDLYKPVFTNYGGRVKIIKTCSNTCQEDLIEICGEGRAGKTKKQLIPIRLFRS